MEKPREIEIPPVAPDKRARATIYKSGSVGLRLDGPRGGALFASVSVAGVQAIAAELDAHPAGLGVPPVERHATLSTAHVDPETAKDLDASALRGVVCFPFPHGWRVHVPAVVEEPDELPMCLRHCFAAARRVSAPYLLFDSDADTVPGLPVYEW